jgi:hypothetical protein
MFSHTGLALVTDPFIDISLGLFVNFGPTRGAPQTDALFSPNLSPSLMLMVVPFALNVLNHSK